MRRIVLTIFVVALVVGLVAPALAEDGPPKILQIGREEVKPGKADAHSMMEASWAGVFRRANWPSYYIAMSSITGPSEVWFLSGYPSLSAWEEDFKSMQKNASLMKQVNDMSARESEFLNSGRGMVTRYREDLSYRTDITLGKMRMFAVRTIRVKPGHGEEFEEYFKMVRAAHEKANVDEHMAMFEVIGGGMAGTFLLFTPHESIAEIDKDPEMHGAAYRQAMGDNQKKMQEMAGNAIMSMEINFFSFDPKMSYPSPQTVAADPGYWQPKTTMTATGGTPKETSSKSKMTPVSKTENKQ